MKTNARILVAIATMLFGGSAMAELITPEFNPDMTACDYTDDATAATCWQDDDGSPSQPTLADLATLVGIADLTGLTVLYKDETDGMNPGEEDGTFAGNYTTSWDPPADEEEASGATISWDGAGSISCPECYLWVKDGQASPNLYVFDIGWWDGETTLTLSDFWIDDPDTIYVNEGRGAISNIGIFGREGSTKVPEPGTLGLLGLAALGLGLVRRRKV